VLLYDGNNLQAMINVCHDRKTAARDVVLETPSAAYPVEKPAHARNRAAAWDRIQFPNRKKIAILCVT
jgi:hypothetical protein